jgi:hypothetical protein
MNFARDRFVFVLALCVAIILELVSHNIWFACLAAAVIGITASVIDENMEEDEREREE